MSLIIKKNYQCFFFKRIKENFRTGARWIQAFSSKNSDNLGLKSYLVKKIILFKTLETTFRNLALKKLTKS